jgi:hypothetical protein
MVFVDQKFAPCGMHALTPRSRKGNSWIRKVKTKIAIIAGHGSSILTRYLAHLFLEPYSEL